MGSRMGCRLACPTVHHGVGQACRRLPRDLAPEDMGLVQGLRVQEERSLHFIVIGPPLPSIPAIVLLTIDR